MNTKQRGNHIHVLAEYCGSTEKCLNVYPIERFDLEKFREQFEVGPDDEHMCDQYAVTPEDGEFLRYFMAELPLFDFSVNAYLIECVVDDR